MNRAALASRDFFEKFKTGWTSKGRFDGATASFSRLEWHGRSVRQICSQQGDKLRKIFSVWRDIDRAMVSTGNDDCCQVYDPVGHEDCVWASQVRSRNTGDVGQRNFFFPAPEIPAFKKIVCQANGHEARDQRCDQGTRARKNCNREDSYDDDREREMAK